MTRIEYRLEDAEKLRDEDEKKKIREREKASEKHRLLRLTNPSSAGLSGMTFPGHHPLLLLESHAIRQPTRLRAEGTERESHGAWSRFMELESYRTRTGISLQKTHILFTSTLKPANIT